MISYCLNKQKEVLNERWPAQKAGVCKYVGRAFFGLDFSL